MKKILVSLDDITIQRIQDIKEMKLETMGIKWSTSEIIRNAIYEKWKRGTIQGIENGERSKK